MSFLWYFSTVFLLESRINVSGLSISRCKSRISIPFDSAFFLFHRTSYCTSMGNGLVRVKLHAFDVGVRMLRDGL